MSTLMKRVQQDHIHISRLMDLLDDQVRLFHLGKSPDYNQMLDIMHYMMNYPSIAQHHEVEELVFAKLRDARPQLKEQADEITAQHNELAKKAHSFTDDLQAIIDGHSILARDQIEQEARYYISLLREHLRQEEADLIPAAVEVLTDEDFKEIEGSMPNLADPLINEQLIEKYESLYKYITDEA